MTPRYRDTHHDLWHWMDLHSGPAGLGYCGADALGGQFLAGQPFVNSHYARQLQGWQALQAETGQDYDATTRTLRFTPGCHGLRLAGWPAAGATLPVFVPGALGTLRLPGAAVDTFFAAASVPPALHILNGHLSDGLEVSVDLRKCGGGLFTNVQVHYDGAHHHA